MRIRVLDHWNKYFVILSLRQCLVIYCTVKPGFSERFKINIPEYRFVFILDYDRYRVLRVKIQS